MKVLVTGAAGFIGSHICKYFFEMGNQVVGWDICESASEWPVYIVDMQNENIIQKKLVNIRPDIIIHCAGTADVSKSVADPQMDYRGNVTVTHNLMFAIHKEKMDGIRVVFMSSAAVYGNPVSLPITERTALNPLSPYALHKVMCEEILQYFYYNYKIDTKIVRIFSAYGEGLRKQIFWDMFCKTQKTGELSMYGTGDESRDYIHVSDVVRAVFLVATKAPKEEVIYNVANGEETTIRAVTESFAQIIGIPQNKIFFSGEGKEGNPINWRSDIGKLKKLGYKKEVDLYEGIRNYVKWAENSIQ